MKNRNVLVGIFAMGGLILFSVGVFFVGNRHEAFTRHVQLYTEFGNLSGLTNGSKVRVAGMDAGEIVAIGVPDSPSSRFRIKFQIDDRLRGLVRTDSMVTIATEGSSRRDVSAGTSGKQRCTGSSSVRNASQSGTS